MGEDAASGRPEQLPQERALIEVGVVGRAHGLDGSFYVRHGSPQLLAIGVAVSYGDQTANITRRAGTDAKPIVRLDGIDTREQAEGLGGTTLYVEPLEAPTLGQNEYWAHQLEGCKVTDGDRMVGVVQRLAVLPSCEVLVVERRGTDAAELLVPMVGDAIREIDVDAKHIDIDLEFLGESAESVDKNEGNNAD